MRRLPLAFFIAAVLAAAFAPSASAGAWGSNGCGTSEQEPSVLAFACADGKVIFETEGWDVWSSDEATASGYLKHPDLDDPSCARRPISACPWVESVATIRLWQPAYCSSNGRWQFLRLRLDAPEDSDPELRTITRHFRCGEYAKPTPPRQPRHRYWQDCGYPNRQTPHTVLVHRVDCSKAKWMVRKIGSVGFLPGKPNPFNLEGFACTIFPRGNRQILCERGSRKVRGAFPGIG